MNAMSVILLVTGILITGVGVVVVGFAVPINDLAIGQTLIIAGATALVGGPMLIGLAAAVNQLTQVAEALKGRPANRPVRSPVVPRPDEGLEVRPGEPRASEVRMTEPRRPEPRPAAPVPTAGSPDLTLEPAAIERLRSTTARAPDPVSTAPNGGQSATAAATEPKSVEITPETRVAEPAARSGATAEPAKEARLDFLFRSRSARPASQEPFDAMWPKRTKRAGANQKPEQPSPVGEAPVSGEDLSVAAPETVPPPPSTKDERSVAILKSGVVDGMAYTLYADGSIEAQLPQGAVRFGSIAELRAHIENNS